MYDRNQTLSYGIQKAIMDEVLTTTEAIKFLKTSKRTLLNLVHNGEVKAKKIGNSYRFLKRDLEDYISQREEKKE
ncbi:MAG TPA: helix-turn-helix domain-containing protein [Desulfatiglandales bacterium]|nr:helix-turn-helix domain-containing protein [Desulfatiglandales bacterium]